MYTLPPTSTAVKNTSMPVAFAANGPMPPPAKVVMTHAAGAGPFEALDEGVPAALVVLVPVALDVAVPVALDVAVPVALDVAVPVALAVRVALDVRVAVPVAVLVDDGKTVADNFRMR